jgi:hypothetical protein
LHVGTYIIGRDRVKRNLHDPATQQERARNPSALVGSAAEWCRGQPADTRPGHEETSGKRLLSELVIREAGFLDDVDLLPDTGDALLRPRACALELYAADLPLAFVIAAGPGLFTEVRSAHEPLVRFFEPLSVGPLDDTDTARALTEPLAETSVRFDADVVAEIVDLAGGRPYYVQKLGYYAFDAATNGRVTRAEFAVAFERAFASVSQEIFAGRWERMSPIDRQVVAIVARSTEPRPSGDIEAEAARRGVRPGAARQSLRRLASKGQIDRLAYGHRGRYEVRDRLFRRYLELQAGTSP